MKVLHISYGSPMINLCRALRLKGIMATSCHFYGNSYNFKPDICLKLDTIKFPQEKLNSFFNKALTQYDIFHFHFGQTFFPDKSDLEILKKAKKKMVVHHHGSEIRALSVAKKLNPYILVKPEWTEEKIHNNLAVLSKYIDHAFVQDYELELYIKDYYKYVHVIPHAIDLNEFQVNYPTAKREPLIVHAPTLRSLKGTECILEAIKSIENSGNPLKFQLVEKSSHHLTKKILSEADIVIDQLRIGSMGYVSTEAMSLGKPVICYLRKDLIEKYPSELPIINANPDSITSVLKKLINQPESWREIGTKGRLYVERYHSDECIADAYIGIYNKL